MGAGLAPMLDAAAAW
ncbi:hypothetical protein ABLO03_21745, partial [Mycobacterium tuberculosis]